MVHKIMYSILFIVLTVVYFKLISLIYNYSFITLGHSLLLGFVSLLVILFSLLLAFVSVNKIKTYIHSKGY